MHQITEAVTDLTNDEVLLKIIIMCFEKHYKVLVHY